MECIVQIYVFIQRLLAPSKNPVVATENVRLRLQSTQSDVEHYVQGNHELKQRWSPIRECLHQETSWIEWKNDGAADWTLSGDADHPWNEQYCRSIDGLTIADIHACLDGNADTLMETDQDGEKDDTVWDMKAAEGLHGQFNRDLELPDFEELKVPNIKVPQCL